MSEDKIKSIKAREISDSRGNPTVMIELTTDKGVFFASVPSGASTGKYEAVELRDEDGKGVKKAIRNVETIIAPALEKEDLDDQGRIDRILIQLDGTKNKSRLGANAILPVSIAVCRAIAAARNIPLYEYISEIFGISDSQMVLPKPSFNMIEGGKHSESGLVFQEFMVISQSASFENNLEIGKEIYKRLKDILEKKFKKISLSFEGAFSAPMNIEETLRSILEASVGENIKIAIDAAASSFYQDDGYDFEKGRISREELIKFYQDFVARYPVISIEDPFSEEDFDGFEKLNEKIGGNITIFGDDLTVSNIERIKIAEEKNACNGLILKPNQIGTVTETLEAAKLAKSFGWKIMVSNRGGETEDDFIADLAAGISADFIKSGSPSQKERMVKYNRLSRIEKEIKAK